MSSPTSGPWSVKDDTWAETGKPFIWIVAEGEGGPVCEINITTMSPETGRANARIVSAAPDLLAACQAALIKFQAAMTIRKAMTGIDTGGNAPTIKLLQDAITKATGEVPA